MLLNGHIDVLSHGRVTVFLDYKCTRTADIDLAHVLGVEVLFEGAKPRFHFVVVEARVRELEPVALPAAPVLNLYVWIGLCEAGVRTVVFQPKADFEELHSCASISDVE